MARPPKRPATTLDNDDVEHPYQESPLQKYRVGARSCRACHQRKVRCDRGVPCTNCSRCGITCMYPTKDREVTRKAPTLQTISNRLERLEVLLSRCLEGSQATTGPAADHGGVEPQTQIRVQNSVNVNTTRSTNQDSSNGLPCRSTWQLLLNDEPVSAKKSDEELLLQDGRRREINQPTPSETVTSHLQGGNTHHTHSAPLSAGDPLRGMAYDVLEFYPDTKLALQLWNVYVKSVDPVLKILHIPTAQSTVIATILEPRSAGSSTVALTFAIYFAAVTALGHDSVDNNNDPINLTAQEKKLFLKNYKMCLDRLLMAPDLMDHPEMMTLQALAIYATCLRVHGVRRRAWVLNGLAIRLAQVIGLHRDGTYLQLSPFETEMRLRLWWHLCVLDSRAPEDQGFQPTVDLINRDLRLPLNVNDNQIYPDMTSLPAESAGWTEMSFFLIQTESCRLLHPILDIQVQHSAEILLDNEITEKRKMIQERGQYMCAKYGILSGSGGVPADLSRIADQHTATAAKKMQFVLQLRKEMGMRKKKGARDNDATPDVLQPSFKLACETLECNHVLLKEGLASSFTWFFNMYTQWYALAYVLRCLCNSPSGLGTERAWTLVEGLFPREMKFDGQLGEGVHGVKDHAHDSIWRCLDLLRSQALSLRQRAQLSVGSENVEIPSSSSGNCTSEPHPYTELPPHPEIDQELIADSDRQSILSSLDLSMAEIPFLSDQDWIAWLNDDGQSNGS